MEVHFAQKNVPRCLLYKFSKKTEKEEIKERGSMVSLYIVELGNLFNYMKNKLPENKETW